MLEAKLSQYNLFQTRWLNELVAINFFTLSDLSQFFRNLELTNWSDIEDFAWKMFLPVDNLLDNVRF